MARIAMRQGTCSQCNASLGGTPAAIEKHLKGCLATRKVCPDVASAQRKLAYYRVFVRDRFSADYWMMLDVRAEDTLTKLDKFLRDTWLECCGHLSGFRIHDVHYESLAPNSRDLVDDWETHASSMRVRISDVLAPGDTAAYIYDYGSSSELTLRVVSERTGDRRTKSVVVLARNVPPEWMCETCGKKRAIAICPECTYDGKGMLCGTCMKTHPCGEEMLLPVVNSPRMGVCGYMGEMGDELLWQMELEELEDEQSSLPHEKSQNNQPIKNTQVSSSMKKIQDSQAKKDIQDSKHTKKTQGSKRMKRIPKNQQLPVLDEPVERLDFDATVPVKDAMPVIFSDLLPDQLEGLIDKIWEMTPAEKETLNKLSGKMFGNLWIALPETHDIRSLLWARSVANLIGMHAILGRVTNQTNRFQLAEELMDLYPALQKSILPYIDPVLLTYWDAALDAGGILVMVDEKDEPKEQIRMLMSFGLLFPFRYVGKKILVAPIEHVKQYPKRVRKGLIQKCQANHDKREELAAILDFHGILPLTEFMEEASANLGEPVTEDQIRLLFGEGIPTYRLEHMGMLLSVHGVQYMMRPDLENPVALLEAQNKTALPHRKSAEFNEPAFTEHLRILDEEIKSFVELLEREIWDADVDIEDKVNTCLDAIRRDVPDEVVVKEMLSGKRKVAPFIRKRAEQMFGSIAEMIPRYSLRGYSRMEMKARLAGLSEPGDGKDKH